MSNKHTNSFTALVFALFAGTVFGFGLILAGMANPTKILAFLDLAGLWDPSLAFVMAGAILIGLVAFGITKNRTLSLLGLQMHIPTIKTIDKRLVFGSLMFGVGWGLAGICPGPALVLLGIGNLKGIVFIIAMLAGMWLFSLWDNHPSK